MLERLQAAEGSGFDRAFARLQVEAYRDAVAMFGRYAEGGETPQLRQYAERALPMLRETLETAQRLQQQIGG